MRVRYIIFTSYIFLLCVVNQSLAQKANKDLFAANSVLSTGTWYRIATIQDGVFRISYSDLVQLGVPEPISSTNFRLYGNGGALLPERNCDFRYDDLIENAVFVKDGGDGFINHNDYILFYGQGTTRWSRSLYNNDYVHQNHYYCDTSYYYITFDHGTGKRIQAYPQIVSLPDTVVHKFNDHQSHEIDSLNLLKSGRQWFGEVFNDNLPKEFRFLSPDISYGDTITARINIVARSLQKSAMAYNLAGNLSIVDSISAIDGNVNSDYGKTRAVTLNALANSDTIMVSLTYNKPEINAVAWLNYIEILSVRNLVYRGVQMPFRNLKTIGFPVTQFEISNMASSIKVWNITDFANISEMPLDINGSNVLFKSYTDSLNEFIAFDDNNTLKIVVVGRVANQNLHGCAHANMIVVTHPDFLSEANTIADFHRINDGMTVYVATTSQIYNEFSSGKQDPTAIRDFIRMVYNRGGDDSLHQLKYVLLFGDGSYDMKNRLPLNTNYVPVWQTMNSLTPTSSYVSDDYFALLDSLEGEYLYGDLDVGVGRFPAENIVQANILVAKAMRYGANEDLLPDSFENGKVSNYGSWRNSVAFIADDEDSNIHLKQAEKLTEIVDSLTRIININKIYLDAYEQVNSPFGTKYPDVNNEIKRQIEKGALLINYTGHGGESGLATEGVITMADIDQYENYYNLPVFITATCEFSRYDNPAYTSAGEKLLLNSKGGAAALFSTTRVAYAHSNEVINRYFIRTVFDSGNINGVRFGDMIRTAKNLCPLGIYMQNFTLLGDPALALAMPANRVVTDFFGTDTTMLLNDTVFNNTVITVRGHIENHEGNILGNFNGKLYPTLYDKPVSYNTLVNDAGFSYPTTFYLQQSELFRGNVTVKNGLFEFSFFVPKDISFSSGYGKLSYYARSNYSDATGLLDSVELFNNGIIDNDDKVGPDIKGYMEDLSFTEGGNTSSEPLMLLHLHDTSGINNLGLVYGHDITAVLDDNINDPVCLNDYFIQDLDKYTSGTVQYRLHSLSYGPHKLTIQAYDLLDNSSEKEINFNVQLPTDVEFGKAYNYPDPFRDITTFYIEHNMSLEDLKLNISVFDITCRKTAEINYIIPAGYYQPLRLTWDARNFNGEPLSKGLYSYIITLTDSNGKQTRCNDKMIILR